VDDRRTRRAVSPGAQQLHLAKELAILVVDLPDRRAVILEQREPHALWQTGHPLDRLGSVILGFPDHFLAHASTGILSFRLSMIAWSIVGRRLPVSQ